MPAPTRLIKKLCGVELFAELSGEQLDWLIETGDFRELVDGDALFREGTWPTPSSSCSAARS